MLASDDCTAQALLCGQIRVTHFYDSREDLQLVNMLLSE